MIKLKVEMPEEYLLEIASNGEEGSGKIQHYIISWAIEQVLKNGLKNKLDKLKASKVEILKNNLIAILGKENVEFLDKMLK